MSIQFVGSNGWVLCHSIYLHEIYQSLKGENICKHCEKYDVFHIECEFIKHGQKRFSDRSIKTVVPADMNSPLPSNSELESSEVDLVKSLFHDLIQELKAEKCRYFDRRCNQMDYVNNVLAIREANEILSIQCSIECNTMGRNTESSSINVTVGGQEYFIPPLCEFYCYQIEELATTLQDLKFDLILLDPPWWNKHIRRKNQKNRQLGYNMMYNESLMEIPVDTLLSSEGLVAVWCTNSKDHLNHLINTLFPSWKIDFLSMWYWMKVTDSGTPVCKFKVGQKKPYERIIFGSRSTRCRELRNPESNKLIISVPSAIHSHKPPLMNILKNYIPKESRCLELFARYLLPGWTSYGNEVLKLQHKQLFTNNQSIHSIITKKVT